MDERPDEVLVEEAGCGGREAFAELVRRHERRVYRLVFGMARNSADADDLAQEVFLTAFRSISAFNRKSSFYTWIYRIAVNTTLTFLRKRGREKARAEFHENLEDTDGQRAASFSPEGESARNELQARVGEAVLSLPPLFRSAFLLVVDQGLSHGEASEILGCSENTVSWRMHKARRMLRERLKSYRGGAGS